jgi:predicted PurR-regulated permease PerM
MTASPPTTARAPVPVRTILVTIGLVLAAAAALWFLAHVQRIIVWLVIAAFFAIALDPAVNWVQGRLLGGRRRALATLLVFLLVVVVLLGIIAVFVVPLARQGSRFVGQLPDLIDQARAGHGVVGRFLERTHVLRYVQDHQSQLKSTASGLTKPAVGVLRGVVTGVVGAITVFVLAYLMVLERPKIVSGFLSLFPERHARRIARVGGDCAKSVNGYIVGNVAISVICGLLTFTVLVVLGVPFAGLLALFVAIVDLIPLVGATLGAVVATLTAFVHSVPAGIITIVFFIVYQQVENHLLQPLVFSRTVKLNPLTVIVAILLAAELAGVLGALLAIPIASMIQVILRDLWTGRRGRPTPQPTGIDDSKPVPDPASSRGP